MASAFRRKRISGLLLARLRLRRRAVDESSLRRRMRQGPAKVHLDIDDEIVSNSEDLGIAKSMTVRIASFIRDEHAIFVRKEIDKVERLDRLAVRPASMEVGFAIEPIIERAREVKILRNQSLERHPIFCYVGVIGCSRDRSVVGCRIRSSLRGHWNLLSKR